MTIRERLDAALAGEPVADPVYAVYDWFVVNRAIDWQSLFDLGLGRIHHASLIEIEQPNLKIVETVREEQGRTRKDVRWITDAGELRELTVDGWRREHLIKTPQDYRIMQRALEGARFRPTSRHFEESERALAGAGFTVGQLGRFGEISYVRTPFQVVQIDFAGLEQFSLDVAVEQPELMDLVEMMNAQFLEALRCAVKTPATQIKLWENLSVETMGPVLYRKHLVPLYRRALDIAAGAGKRLQVHYDGKLRIVAGDIASLAFDGLDSMTPPPEGDMTVAEARRRWPDKFFWLHPSLTWDALPDQELQANIRQMVKDGGRRFCLQLSEEVPPNWRRTVPLILRTLSRDG
jgi:hypothetical protein